MDHPTTSLRRVLTAILAVAPLLASADLCTVGVLTGRAGLMCGMESGMRDCRVVPAPVARCSHCASAAPVSEKAPSRGPTCCDLRPQAEGAASQPVLVLPRIVSHPAAVSASAIPVIAVASPHMLVADDGRAPPAEPPPPPSPRAPPLG